MKSTYNALGAETLLCRGALAVGSLDPLAVDSLDLNVCIIARAELDRGGLGFIPNCAADASLFNRRCRAKHPA